MFTGYGTPSTLRGNLFFTILARISLPMNYQWFLENGRTSFPTWFLEISNVVRINKAAWKNVYDKYIIRLKTLNVHVPSILYYIYI